MKATSRCFSSARVVVLFCLAAAVFAAPRLKAQDTSAFASETDSLWLTTGDTNVLQESLAVLQERLAGADFAEKPDGSRKAGDNLLTTTNRFLDNFDVGGVEAFWLRPDSRVPIGQYGVAPKSGGMLQSLVVNNHVLNVNFADNNKSGLAAIGQTASDYWNPYPVNGGNGNGFLDTQRDPFHKYFNWPMTASGVQVQYVDDWFVYHMRDGETHCSSNERRATPPIHWWNHWGE